MSLSRAGSSSQVSRAAKALCFRASSAKRATVPTGGELLMESNAHPGMPELQGASDQGGRMQPRHLQPVLSPVLLAMRRAFDHPSHMSN
eukprot:593575-Rhodomonas_salina.2